jgi:hypothetical protein
MRKPSSSDMQWYDRALEIGALSPNKTDWNYCGHYVYEGTSGKYKDIHTFQDIWDPEMFIICDFEGRVFTPIDNKEDV